MVALAAEGFNPDCLENHTKLVRHVGDVPRLVGTVGTKEGEVEFVGRRLLRHSDLVFKIGLELKNEVHLLLSAEVGLFFIKTFLHQNSSSSLRKLQLSGLSPPISCYGCCAA